MSSYLPADEVSIKAILSRYLDHVKQASQPARVRDSGSVYNYLYLYV